MSLLQTIKNDALEARKARASLRANFLSTLVSEAAMVGKNDGDRESTDAEVTATIRKFLKQNKDMQETLTKAGKPLGDVIKIEQKLLEKYLPQMLSRERLVELVTNHNFTTGTEINMRNMKSFKEAIETQYPGQVDGKLLAEVMKEAQS